MATARNIDGMDAEFLALVDEYYAACRKGDMARAIETAEQLAQEAPSYDVQQYWYGCSRECKE